MPFTNCYEEEYGNVTVKQNMIADHKISRVHHIRSKVLANDPSRRKFWRFISSQIKSAGAITGLYDSSKNMVF